MNAQRNLANNKALAGYYKVLHDIVQVQFPHLSLKTIDECIRYSINKRYRPEQCTIDNNYTHKKATMSLLELTNYILEREPVITSWGCLFKRKNTCPNPLMNMIKGFMVNRGLLKDEMFKYPKGCEEFEKYNLLQILEKLNANGTLTYSVA